MGMVQIERRRRGLFGWIVAIVFWGFNALMLLWLVLAFKAGSEVAASADSSAGAAGAAIGTGLAATMVLGIWLLGSIILGIMMFFTRGKRIIETVER